MNKGTIISLYSLIVIGLLLEWCCILVILFGEFNGIVNICLWIMIFCFAALAIYGSVVVQIIKEA
ncbi:MAG: hypothetical protein RR324_01145 [Cellulosilyticaceae bacterium]